MNNIIETDKSVIQNRIEYLICKIGELESEQPWGCLHGFDQSLNDRIEELQCELEELQEQQYQNQ